MNATDPTGGARQQFRDLLASLASKTQAKLPALNGRVEKACKLVLCGDVELRGEKALVHSLSDPAKTYTLEPGHCTCADFPRAPEYLCAHRLAVGFLRKVQELLAAQPAPAPEPTPAALPEAPVSITLKATLHGHEVLVTLRGVDFASVQAQVEQASAWLRAQAPAQPTNDGRQCPIHGVPMQLNHGKEGRTWWSHKTVDGWCKGR